ncbi:thioredoxin-disulfide reductase [Mycoplasmoides alvi]|uniref:thioredoxin-disulfide reductase n=1 Tax=Mycoplasmoides alvi TaxID=78580 RepID=UPI00051B39C3|nr:thioredoxin-disulfide reductase [Mycoplasmoides alvi]
MFSISGTQNLFDLVIIGSGPSGMAAGIYASRANLKCCIIEAKAPGGKMIKTGIIENYPGILSKTGPELSIEMFNQINNLKIPIKYNLVISIEKSDNYFLSYLNNGETVFSKAVIIATGCNEKAMQTPGEEKFYNKGISYCAICDGSLYKNKVVAVVGGGNAAVDETIYLSNIVQKVYLVHRRDEFRADAFNVERLKKIKNVEFYLSYVPEKVNGDSKVSSFTIRSVKNDSLVTLDVDCVFPYIGAIPATSFLNNLKITNELGYVLTNEEMETKIPGLYAVGDCISKKYRQISTAVNDGTIAALNVKEYLSNQFN